MRKGNKPVSTSLRRSCARCVGKRRGGTFSGQAARPAVPPILLLWRRAEPAGSSSPC